MRVAALPGDFIICLTARFLSAPEYACRHVPRYRCSHMNESDRPARHRPRPALPVPGSVLLGLPRWTSDGGVSAHVQTSAAILARHGLDVRVLSARMESAERDPRSDPVSHPQSCSTPMRRWTSASARRWRSSPEMMHFHQVDLPDLVEAMRRERAAVVVSAHVYRRAPLACTTSARARNARAGTVPGVSQTCRARLRPHARPPAAAGRYRLQGRQAGAGERRSRGLLFERGGPTPRSERPAAARARPLHHHDRRPGARVTRRAGGWFTRGGSCARREWTC